MIIADAKLVDAHEILKDFNSRGTSAYTVKGRFLSDFIGYSRSH